MNEYLKIIKHYEDCLEKHGDNHKGVDWPNYDEMIRRYKIMLEIAREQNFSVLDVGCGTAGLLEYINTIKGRQIVYSGLEISAKFFEIAKNKFPENQFYNLDLLKNDQGLKASDYVVMNGVFTERRDLSFDQMYDYFLELLVKSYSFCKKGLAFNVMSKNVDWEREDLFHVPKDRLEKDLSKKLSRNIIFRCDYKLFEYTVYVYKDGYE